MPIHFVSGDLFANEHNVEAFAHGCNCQGSMGAGIAVTVKENYPAMYEEYRRRCKVQPREFNLGEVFLWREDGKMSVFNLATQENTWNARATYPNIEATLRRMRELAGTEGIRSISMPRIGAGYGGLSWKKCRAIIEQIFNDWDGDLYVYEAFVPND